MCAPSPPPAPDYAGAAKQQGAANIEAARVQGMMNNPNVVSPYGTQTTTWQGDQPTLTQQFSPEQQQVFEQGNQAKLALSQLANRGAGQAGEVLGQNVNFSGLPAAPTSGGVNQRVIDAMMGRVNEDYGKAQEEKNAALIAAGHRPGGKGYDDSMQLLQRGRNDAAQQAVLAGYQQGGVEFDKDTQSRRNAIAEYLQQRQVPLNEVTALMSGSQVNNPFAMPAYAQNAQVAAPPLFGAAQQAGNWESDLYNAQAAQAGNLQQGLFGLGGAGLMAGGMMMSDRRLKSNIVRIGTHPLGIGWYEYDLDGYRTQGVMADEVETVKPDAVLTMPNGYLAVDYGRL